MSEKALYPYQAAGKVNDLIRAQMTEANRRFGVTDGALVRMALEAFLPGYLAAQGRPENVEFLAKVSSALENKPELKEEIERVVRVGLRKGKAA